MQQDRLEAFSPSQHNIEDWEEFFGLFVDLHDIAANKKKNLLLTHLSHEVFSTVKNLILPAKVTDGVITEGSLRALLIKHYKVGVNKHVGRQVFQDVKQEGSESITNFAIRLRKAANDCEFGVQFDERLRDQLIIGMADLQLKEKLYTDVALTTFEDMLTSAVRKEQLHIQFKKMCIQPTVAEVHLVGGSGSSQASGHTNFNRSPSNGGGGKSTNGGNNFSRSTGGGRNVNIQSCGRCNNKHPGKPCRFEKATCFHCGAVGHIAPACDKKARGIPAVNRTQSNMVKTVNITEDNNGEGQEQQYGDSDGQMYQIRVVNNSSSMATSAIRLEALINNKLCRMELDTGATESLMPWHQFCSMGFSRKLLNPSTVRFRAYSGEIIPLIGVAQVTVTFHGESKVLPLYVVEQSGVSLFGMSWITAFGLRNVVNLVERTNQRGVVHSITVSSIAARFPELFNKAKRGTMAIPPIKLFLKANAQPRYFRPRPVPLALQDTLRSELNKMVDAGVVEKIPYSEWASPVVLVLKKDGGLRLCGDYKVGVNSNLENVEYALPLVSDIFAKLNGCTLFSKLDLSAAYNQLRLEEGSRQLTTITTPYGLYRYTVLPFGIATAPAMFQQTMDKMLAGLTQTFGYLDDIIVGGGTAEQHESNLKAVLNRLRHHQVILNEGKCIFGVKRIEYLGHILSAEGLSPTEEKVAAVKQAIPPTDTKTLRAFLGVINYYGKFMHNLAATLAPLYDLLKKEKKWQWGEKEDEAFEAAKAKLTGELCLAHYDPKAHLIVTSDASPTGVGAILSQQGGDGKERPVAFASRKLNQAEIGYSQIEKEGLGIMVAMKKFHHFIFGRRFTLRTDHRPLVNIFHPKKSIPTHTLSRINRWALILSEYTYDIEYIRTERMAADYFSRAPVEAAPAELASWDRTVNAVADRSVEQLPLTALQLTRATQNDGVLSKVVDFIVNGWPGENEDGGGEMGQFRKIREGLHINRDLVMYGSRVVIPQPYRAQVMEELHKCHAGMVKMKAKARQHVYWPNINSELEQKVRECDKCQQFANATPESMVIPNSWPQEPWTILNLDLAGPIAGKMLMILVDQTSKWMEVAIIPRTDSSTIIVELRKIFATFGFPLTIVADNATYFQSEEMNEFCSRNGIRLAASAPYHPRSNGAAERAVQTVKQVIAKMRDETSLQTIISRFLLDYRSTPQTTTGKTPAEILMGRSLRTRMDLIKPSTATAVLRKQEASIRGRVPEELVIGQRVFVREFPFKKNCPKNVEGFLIAHTSTYTFQVQLMDGSVVYRHRDHIRGMVAQQRPQVASQESTTMISTGGCGSAVGSSGPSREQPTIRVGGGAMAPTGSIKEHTLREERSLLRLTSPIQMGALSCQSTPHRHTSTMTRRPMSPTVDLDVADNKSAEGASGSSASVGANSFEEQDEDGKPNYHVRLRSGGPLGS